MPEEEESGTSELALPTLLKQSLPQFIGFELLFRLLSFAVFTPISAWLGARLIALSGNGAISNYDLTGFFLSPTGLAYLTVVVSIAFTLAFFEFGGLVALAIAKFRGSPIRLPQLLFFLGKNFARLWRLSVRQFLTYLAYAAPCLAVAGGAYLFFLTDHDIYYYLNAKPPAFWTAAIIAGLAGLVFALFAIKLFAGWVYSVPILLLDRTSPKQALDQSRSLVAGRRREVIAMLLKWLAWTAALTLVGMLVMFLLRWLLLSLAGERVGAVLLMTSLLGIANVLIAGLTGILSMAYLGITVGRSYLTHRPDSSLPDHLIQSAHALWSSMTRVLTTSWAIILILGAVTVFGTVQLINKIEFHDSVGITAHRGSSLAAPENSLAAIMLAVEEGSDFVEIDVQETRDGVVVLAHDKDLKRVWGISKGIWEVDYAELKDLDSGSWFSPDFSDQRIKTLAEVIEAVKGKAKLNIELKFNGHQQKLAKEVVRIVKEHDFVDQCILTSLDYDGIRRAAAEDPAIRTGVIVTSAIGDVTSLEADLLSVGAGTTTRDLIDRARHRDLEVHVWTVNDIPTMNTMIGLGVDQIITDDPKLLGEVIRERASLSKSEKLLLQLADIADGWW